MQKQVQMISISFLKMITKILKCTTDLTTEAICANLWFIHTVQYIGIKTYFQTPAPCLHTVHTQTLLNPTPTPRCVHTTWMDHSVDFNYLNKFSENQSVK